MIELFVSPNGVGDGLSFSNPTSILNARSTVRQLTGQDNITVFLLDGRYELSETLVFNNLDSGSNGFVNIWRAYPGSQPILSGGIKLETWTPVPGKPWIYQADLPAGVNFRYLMVNGLPAKRTELIINDGDSINDAFLEHDTESFGTLFEHFTNPLDFTTCINKQDIELHSAWYRWGFARFKCSGQIDKVVVDLQGNIRYKIYCFGPTYEFQDSPLRAEFESYGYVYPDYPPSSYTLMTTNPWRGFGYPDNQSAFEGTFYSLQNIFELLTSDAKGCFYLNKRLAQPKVYYIPNTGEDIFQSEIYAPRLNTALLVENAANLFFIGLHIRNCEPVSLDDVMWSEGGFHNPQYLHFDTDLNISGIPTPPSANVRYSSNIHFIQCYIRECSGDGMVFGKGTKDCSFNGSLVHDINGSAIINTSEANLSHIYDLSTAYNKTLAPEDWWKVTIKDESVRNTRNRFSSNKIHSLGFSSSGLIALWNESAEKTLIENNEIFNLHYMPIVSRGNFGNRYYPFDILIRRNLSHETMLTRSDGGVLYASGGQAGLTFEENVAYNISTDGVSSYHKYPIYFDDFGWGMTARKNVILPNAQGGPGEGALIKTYACDYFVSTTWYNFMYPLPIGDNNVPCLHPHQLIDNYFHTSMAGVPSNGTAPNLIVRGTTYINGTNPASWPSEVNRIVSNAGLKVIEGHKVTNTEYIIYGWKKDLNPVTLSTTQGQIIDYEEPIDDMWRARIINVNSADLLVTATSGTKTQTYPSDYIPIVNHSDYVNIRPVSIYDRTGQTLIQIIKAIDYV
jgi:hypothetical protein